MSKLSVSEIRAVAEAAINARHSADAAKAAFDAKPDDEILKAAYNAAEQTAVETKVKADALSQESTLSPEQIAKMKRKRAIIDKELRDAGALSDDIESDDDDGEDDLDDEYDLDKPVTRRDLQRIETRRASQTAKQMAAAIEDPLAKKAVQDALTSVVPSGDPQKDFKNAVAIANQDKNSKILEEISRRAVAPQHRSGAGSPPRPAEGNFEPTAEEQTYMRPPFNLTKEQILKARGQ